MKKKDFKSKRIQQLHDQFHGIDLLKEQAELINKKAEELTKGKKIRRVDHIAENLSRVAKNIPKKEKVGPTPITVDELDEMIFNAWCVIVHNETGIPFKEMEITPEQDALINNLAHWVFQSKSPDLVKKEILQGDERKAYIKEHPGKLNPRKSLYIYGEKGVGKTTIIRAMCQVMKHIEVKYMYNKRVFLFSHLPTYFLQILTDSELAQLKRLVEPKHMVLNELKEDQFTYKHFGNDCRFVNHILDTRHEHWLATGVQTIITTNLAPSTHLVPALNDSRLHDRILHQYEVILLKGDNQRRKS